MSYVPTFQPILLDFKWPLRERTVEFLKRNPDIIISYNLISKDVLFWDGSKNASPTPILSQTFLNLDDKLYIETLKNGSSPFSGYLYSTAVRLMRAVTREFYQIETTTPPSILFLSQQTACLIPHTTTLDTIEQQFQKINIDDTENTAFLLPIMDIKDTVSSGHTSIQNFKKAQKEISCYIEITTKSLQNINLNFLLIE
jgi:hypothetical protein